MQKCNICDNKLHLQIMNGLSDQVYIQSKTDNCPTCGARPRIKTFRIVYDSQLVCMLIGHKDSRRALVISGVSYTIERVALDFGEVISAALYGRYGKETIKSDLRDLREFSDESFDYIGATLVLDYIPEHDQVFKAVNRVLKKGGRFLFHIAESRLLNDSTPTFIKNYKKNIIFKEQYPVDYKMPSIKVGRGYLIEEMQKSGFSTQEFNITDIFSGVKCTWFLAKKVN